VADLRALWCYLEVLRIFGANAQSIAAQLVKEEYSRCGWLNIDETVI